MISVTITMNKLLQCIAYVGILCIHSAGCNILVQKPHIVNTVQAAIYTTNLNNTSRAYAKVQEASLRGLDSLDCVLAICIKCSPEE